MVDGTGSLPIEQSQNVTTHALEDRRPCLLMASEVKADAPAGIADVTATLEQLQMVHVP